MKESGREDMHIHKIDKICDILGLDEHDSKKFISDLDNHEMIENGFVCWIDLSELIDICNYTKPMIKKLLRYYYRSIELIYKDIILNMQQFDELRIDGEGPPGNLVCMRDVSDDLVIYKATVEKKCENEISSY
jgi:hypothetical protein